ncbi:MAG: hypothetical protein JW936_10740 [Sedimentisphaerales bacterium]|nr:hypothetical protein [Sedimentisphaerales bacterium]
MMNNEYMRQAYWLDPRDKPGLLMAVMRQLAGNAHLALEGYEDDMAEMSFDQIQGVREGIVPPFRHEYDEKAKFVVLPLEADTMPLIMQEILPEGRIVHKVGAIQIEKNGAIEFLVGDNFDQECVSAGPGVPEQLLRDLVVSGVLRAYRSRVDDDDHGSPQM